MRASSALPPWRCALNDSPLVRCITTALILAATPVPVLATTIHVPGDVAAIQDAINAARAGDTVLVACRTYTEQWLSMRSGVTLRSELGDPDCVWLEIGHIDCVDVGPGTRIEGLYIDTEPSIKGPYGGD